MIDREQLEKHVHDVLAHLYDAPYLEDHSLARWLAPVGGAEAPGRVLRRLLLEAIQSLKPPPDAPPDSQAASRYQFLYLRYVRAEPIQQIARELALGERQIYRRQRDALAAVAAALWELRPPHPAAPPAAVAPALPSATGSAPAAGRDVQLEVDRIGSVAPYDGTDLVQVLRSTLATVGNLARGDRRPVSVEIAPGLPPVSVDRVAIRQAILGLLVYAIDADGDIALQADATATRVRLRVRTRRRPGTVEPGRLDEDSNLAVSRRLVELQRGEFAARADGDWLEIAIELPVARPRTILVVDDNQDTLGLFSRYLEGRAQRVLTASTGEEALRAIAEARPDAVVLDVMLPSADGWEVLQSVRSHPDTELIPVVVCTVLKQRELALSLGATEFVAKPATQGSLLAALDRCWSGR